jgi:hypothetical protein
VSLWICGRERRQLFEEARPLVLGREVEPASANEIFRLSTVELGIRPVDERQRRVREKPADRVWLCLDEGSIALLTLRKRGSSARRPGRTAAALSTAASETSGDRPGAQVTLVDLPHVDLGNQAEAEVGDRLEGCQHPAPGIVAADHRARTPGERRGHRVCRRTAEGDRIVRLLRATRGRQKHDEIAFSVGELYLGGLADPLLAQEAMRFQDLRKGTR